MHETGATGKTFKAVMSYIQRSKPKMVLLENLEELMELDSDGKSDADYIIAQLVAEGYMAQRFIVKAENHGSWCTRTRFSCF